MQTAMDFFHYYGTSAPPDLISKHTIVVIGNKEDAEPVDMKCFFAVTSTSIPFVAEELVTDAGWAMRPPPLGLPLYAYGLAVVGYVSLLVEREVTTSTGQAGADVVEFTVIAKGVLPLSLYELHLPSPLLMDLGWRYEKDPEYRRYCSRTTYYHTSPARLLQYTGASHIGSTIAFRLKDDIESNPGPLLRSSAPHSSYAPSPGPLLHASAFNNSYAPQRATQTHASRLVDVRHPLRPSAYPPSVRTGPAWDGKRWSRGEELLVRLAWMRTLEQWQYPADAYAMLAFWLVVQQISYLHAQVELMSRHVPNPRPLEQLLDVLTHPQHYTRLRIPCVPGRLLHELTIMLAVLRLKHKEASHVDG